MPESRANPYFMEAMRLLPKDDRLEHCVAEYLYMRLSKDKHLSVSDWKECIMDLVKVYGISPTSYIRCKKGRSVGRTKRTLVAEYPPRISIPDLCYLFLTATHRKWNHVYFTKEQDIMYDNISFYQDPYWQKMIRDPETRQRLEEQLKECKNEWSD